MVEYLRQRLTLRLVEMITQGEINPKTNNPYKVDDINDQTYKNDTVKQLIAISYMADPSQPTT